MRAWLVVPRVIVSVIVYLFLCALAAYGVYALLMLSKLRYVPGDA